MNFSPLLRVQGGYEYSDDVLAPIPFATIHRFLRLVAQDTSLESEFSQVWAMQGFQLGDVLGGVNEQNVSDTNNFVSIVCQGQVRLLGYDFAQRREVSTQLLSSGESFGGDGLFCVSPFAYRAVAASEGVIAQISITNLEMWLQKISNLHPYFLGVVEKRQELIFFKTYTQLRSQTSLALQQILPYFTKIQINAGKSLLEYADASKGRFWLRQGRIWTLNHQTPAPSIGHSWGYPDETIPNWTAETDLVLYHLPKQNCDLVVCHTKYEDDKEKEEKSDDLSLSSIPLQISPLSFGEATITRTISERTSNTSGQAALPHIIANQESNTSGQAAITKKLHQQQFENDETDPQTCKESIPSQQVLPTPHLLFSTPFVRQQSSSDCGAACLAMVCLYWGKRISLNTLRNLTQTNRTGASLLALVAAAENLGYQAVGVRASLSVLEWQSTPWIAHWQGNHYVVVWRVRGNQVVVCDPAIGKRTYKRNEFEANWTGYALILSPTERLHQLQSEKISLASIWPILWVYRRLLLQIALASVVMQLFGLAAPLIARVVIDKVIPDSGFLTLNIFAVGFLVFGIWRLLVQASRQYLLDYLSNHMDVTLVSGFVRHTLKLPSQFFAFRQVGDIVSRVEENHKVQRFLTQRAVSILLDALMTLSCLGLIAHYNLQLALLVLGCSIPIAFFTWGTNPYLKNVSADIARQKISQNTALVEMIAAITTVKTNASEQWMRWRWEERFANMVKARFRGQRLANNLHLGNNIINHLSSSVLLWCAATLVMQGELSLGQFVAINMLVGNIINPLLALVELRNEYQEVLVCVERINDVLQTPPEINPQQPLPVLPQMWQEIYFDNVSILHLGDEERYSLRNLSFRVTTGQTIGIVGTSSSGKTTLVNLLAGLYHPHSGRILIDGQDIVKLDPQSLRTQLAIAPQESFLFSGTILENITLFNPEFTVQQAIVAAKKALAHDFIQALPLGYNTPISTQSKTLSGEQRQRIVVARALIRNPRILVLDEATNLLNAQTESLLQQNLLHDTSNRITFIVTPSLNTLYHADHILVLDRGILVEQGNHHQLIANNALYVRLIQQLRNG